MGKDKKDFQRDATIAYEKKVQLYQETNIQNLTKKYITLLSKFDNLSEEEFEKMLLDVKGEIENYEFQMFKAKLQIYSFQKDHMYNQQQQASIEKDCQQRIEEIKQYKEELKAEETRRQAKQEINLITPRILAYQKSEIIEKEIQNIDNEIKNIKENHQQQLLKIDNKRVQFNNMLDNIQSILEPIHVEDLQKNK